MTSNPSTCITEVEIIKAQTWNTYGCITAVQSPCAAYAVRRLCLIYSDDAAAVSGLWRKCSAFAFCLFCSPRIHLPRVGLSVHRLRLASSLMIIEVIKLK